MTSLGRFGARDRGSLLLGLTFLSAVGGNLLGGCRSGPVPAHVAAPGSAQIPAQAAPERTLEKLWALLWFQTAAEARLVQSQTFLAASAALEQALRDPSWSALDQGAAGAGLPPAVIADIDETLLDNSDFEGWMQREGRRFNGTDWTRWVEAAAARPIPGAVEFARFAAERGVTLFYVTNRDFEHEAATLANLAALGFPLPDGVDVLLLRGERPEWSSDKESRRRWIAGSHRVLLLIGDDFNDFISGTTGVSVEQRAELTSRLAGSFGSRWFMLPNPLYGSWERALDAGLPPATTRAEELERRLGRVRAFPTRQ